MVQPSKSALGINSRNVFRLATFQPSGCFGYDVLLPEHLSAVLPKYHWKVFPIERQGYFVHFAL